VAWIFRYKSHKKKFLPSDTLYFYFADDKKPSDITAGFADKECMLVIFAGNAL
jgi:hypothetical protein